MTISPARQPYTLGDLAAVIRADFAEHRISARVEIGEWAPEAGRGEPRVVLGLGRLTLGEPSGHYQPGAWFPAGKDTDGSELVARPVLDDAQRFTVLVHAPGSAKTGEGAAEAAQRATDQLMRQTARAIRDALAAPLRETISGEWNPPAESGYEGYVYGSLVKLEVTLASPVLGDTFKLGAGGELDVDSSFSFPDGGTTPPETIEETTT